VAGPRCPLLAEVVAERLRPRRLQRAKRRVADDEHGVGSIVEPDQGGRGHLVAEREQNPQEPHGGRGLACHGDAAPAELLHGTVGEEEHALRSGGAHDPERQADHGSLEPEAVGEREWPGVDPTPRHRLAEGAGRQGVDDGPGEGVEERLDVQVGDAADPQHQLHTLITL
jgi:hypothetical protein